jgi:ankyrin repeat protein
MDEQLIAAIESKNLQRVEELLAAGANPNASQEGQTAYQLVPHGADEIKCALIEAGADDPDLWSALVWVIHTGRVEAVRVLLRKGADVNVPTYSGTPIQVAARGGHVEIAELLIEAGCDVDAASSVSTPLISAIEKGHSDIALKLLQAGADPNRKPSFGDAYPIALASAQGDAAVIRALITAGADMNAPIVRATIKQREQQTDWADPEIAVDTFPVILTARCGHGDALATLLEMGADAHRKDGEGFSAYDWATRNEDQAVLAVLHRFGITETRFTAEELLLLSAQTGNLDILQSALNQGADVNARDDRRKTRGKTALILASIAGHLQIVQALLSAGADPNLTDQGANSELVSEVLLEHAGLKSLVDGGYCFARSAIIAAAAIGQTKIIQTLIQAGANPNDKDAIGGTPLALAAENNHLETVQALVSAGALVNQTAIFGNTPFLLACEKGAVEVAEFLVHHGADITIVNRDRETALMKAAALGNFPLVRLCIGQGETVNALSSERQTALTQAAGASHHVLFDESDPNSGRSGSLEYRDDGCWEYRSLPEAQIIEVVQLLLQSGADPNLLGSATTSLIQAAGNGHLQLVQTLLAAGARLDIRDRSGDTAVSIAQLYRRQEILSFFRDYVGTDLSEFEARGHDEDDRDDEDERWGEELPQPDFSEAAQDPNYQQAIQQLAERCGSQPIVHDDHPGWVSVHVDTKRRTDLNIDELQREFLDQGYFVYLPDSYYGEGPERVCILPTTDKYDAIALHQTNGCNYGVGPGYVTQWLKELEETQPFVLTCIAHDTLSGRFLTPIEDPEGLAELMYEFCPDLVDQGVGTIERLVESLTAGDSLYFWWD